MQKFKNIFGIIVITIIITLIISSLLSCTDTSRKLKVTENKVIVCEIAVIDSCEYLHNIFNVNSHVYTHNGNCKFCQQRLIKLLTKNK
jgi:hypothetical protein